MKIIAVLLCVGMVVSGIVYSVVMAESPLGGDEKITNRNSQNSLKGQPRALPTVRTPKSLENYNRTPRSIGMSPQDRSGPPQPQSMGQFTPINSFNSPNSNGPQPFRAPQRSGSFSSAARPDAVGTTNASKKSAAAYTNAIDVQTLIRASYRLPKQTADVLEQLFQQDASASVETLIVTAEDSPFVVLKVTTDSARQQSIANFLNSLYPKSTLDKMQVDFDAAKESETETSDSSPQTDSGAEESDLESDAQADQSNKGDVSSFKLPTKASETQIQQFFKKDFPAE